MPASFRAVHCSAYLDAQVGIPVFTDAFGSVLKGFLNTPAEQDHSIVGFFAERRVMVQVAGLNFVFVGDATPEPRAIIFGGLSDEILRGQPVV